MSSSDTPDITLYTWLTPNGIKVSIALEELSLPYQTIAVDISTNAQKEPWYVAINPNGRIPALMDKGQRIFESGAILQFLVDKYDNNRDISYEPGSPEYYEQQSWLMFQMGGLGPMQGMYEQENASYPCLHIGRSSKSFPSHGRGVLCLWYQSVYERN